MLTLKTSEIQISALIAFRLVHEQTARLSDECIANHKANIPAYEVLDELNEWLNLANKISPILEVHDKEVSVPMGTVELISRIIENKSSLQDAGLVTAAAPETEEPDLEAEIKDILDSLETTDRSKLIAVHSLLGHYQNHKDIPGEPSPAVDTAYVGIKAWRREEKREDEVMSLMEKAFGALA